MTKITVAKILIIMLMLALVVAMAFGCDETSSTVVGTVTPDDQESTSSLTYTEYSDGSVAVTAFAGDVDNVVVSATAGGKAVTAIGNVFQGTSIKSISLPATVTHFSDSCFKDCTNLNRITAKGVVSIGYAAFDNTKWLSTRKTDELLYFNNVFIGIIYDAKTAADFETVEFPAATTSAQTGAFSSLTATKSYSIPATMYLTGREFDGFSSIEKFAITTGKGSKKYWKNISTGELISADGTIFCKYPEGNANAEYTIPSSVKIVDKYAFQNAQLSSLTFGCTADIVRDYAFSNCSNLTTIAYSGNTRGFKECGGYVFNGCTMLESFTTPAILVKIGDNAFVNSSVKELTFKKTTTFTEIGKNAFKGLRDFAGDGTGRLILPDSVKKIGISAFSNTAITNITLGAGTERVGAMAFYGTPIEQITLNEGLLTLGDEVFYQSSITSIVLPNSLLAIGNACFAYSDISSVYFGTDGSTDTTDASLEYIGGSAFRNTPLKSFEMPFTVTQVGAYAFAGTSELATVKVLRSQGSEITESGMYVFDGSTANIRVPVDSVSAYKAAYGWQDFAEKIDVFDRTKDSYTFVFHTSGGGAKASLTYPSISLKREDAAMVHVAKDQTPYSLVDVDQTTIKKSSEIYLLEGWYKDATYTEKVSFTDAGAVLTIADFTEVKYSETDGYYYINLYAKWITYNIAFDVKGGSAIDSINTSQPNVALTEITPTLNDATFEGWYYDADLQIAVEVLSDAINVAADRYVEGAMTYKYSHFVQYTYYTYNVTLYAKWRQNNENN